MPNVHTTTMTHNRPPQLEHQKRREQPFQTDTMSKQGYAIPPSQMHVHLEMVSLARSMPPWWHNSCLTSAQLPKVFGSSRRFSSEKNLQMKHHCFAPNLILLGWLSGRTYKFHSSQWMIFDGHI